MYEERRARVWRSQVGAGGEGTFIVQVGVLAFSVSNRNQLELGEGSATGARAPPLLLVLSLRAHLECASQRTCDGIVRVPQRTRSAALPPVSGAM